MMMLWARCRWLLGMFLLVCIVGCKSDTPPANTGDAALIAKYVDENIAHVYLSDFNSCEFCYARLLDDFRQNQNDAIILLLTEKEKVSLEQHPYLAALSRDKVQLVRDADLYHFFILHNAEGKLDAVRIDRVKGEIQTITTI